MELAMAPNEVRREWSDTSDGIEHDRRQRASRWSGGMAGGYAAVLPGPSFSNAQHVPGAISRNFGPNNENIMCNTRGAGEHGGARRSWLKPVSSLLQGIAQSRREVTSRLDEFGNAGGDGGRCDSYFSSAHSQMTSQQQDSSPRLNSERSHSASSLVGSPTSLIGGCHDSVVDHHGDNSIGGTPGSDSGSVRFTSQFPTSVTMTPAVGITNSPRRSSIPMARITSSSSSREETYYYLPMHHHHDLGSTMREPQYEQADVTLSPTPDGHFHASSRQSQFVNSHPSRYADDLPSSLSHSSRGGGGAKVLLHRSAGFITCETPQIIGTLTNKITGSRGVTGEQHRNDNNTHNNSSYSRTNGADNSGNTGGAFNGDSGSVLHLCKNDHDATHKNITCTSASKCLFAGCCKRPTYTERRGGKATFCGEHRSGGMVDVVKRNHCQAVGCTKQPRYALPGEKAEFCSQHKMDNYVDVKHPRCESSMGCVRQPTFGWEGEKARFCSAHKVEGMLDVKNPRCAEPGCIKRPRYGEEGERARFCAAHKFDHMVDMASRRGNKCNSPPKRPRDGRRWVAHDAADASAAAAPHRSSIGVGPMPFSLTAEAPPRKRGHTVSHAGGHRRAASESWVDFCPKRLYGTTSSTDNAGSIPSNDNRISSAAGSAGSSSIKGMPSLPPFVIPCLSPMPTMHSTAPGQIAAPRAMRTVHSPIFAPSSGSNITTNNKQGGDRGGGDYRATKDETGRRFGPMDYEAGAILLECRSRPVVSHDSAERRTAFA